MDQKAVVLQGFSIKPTVFASTVKVDLQGSADNDSKSALKEFIEHLHGEVEHRLMSEVIVDLHELYFINPMCLKVFAQWIERVVNMSANRRYKLTFLVDPRLNWQDRSFVNLQRLAPDFVHITNWKVD